MTINEVLKDALQSIKSCIDTDIVMGTPVINEENLCAIPISKMTMGFATVVGEFDTKNKNSEMPIGGIGGGANIKPIGFLIIRGKEVKFIKTEGEINQWSGLIENLLGFLSR